MKTTITEALEDGTKQPREWIKPTGEMFEDLASRSPARLVELLLGAKLEEIDLARGAEAVGRKLTDVELSFAAEACGGIEDSVLAIAGLLPLLSHPTAPVREGAIYGLQRHLEASEEARSALRLIAESDASPGVRRAASDALLFEAA
jgi:HEAT repeat protein